MLIQTSNGTLAKLRTAPHTSGDAARPLPHLTIALAEVNCPGPDAVANELAEALQRLAKASAVRQLPSSYAADCRLFLAKIL